MRQQLKISTYRCSYYNYPAALGFSTSKFWVPNVHLFLAARVGHSQESMVIPANEVAPHTLCAYPECFRPIKSVEIFNFGVQIDRLPQWVTERVHRIDRICQWRHPTSKRTGPLQNEHSKRAMAACSSWPLAVVGRPQRLAACIHSLLHLVSTNRAQQHAIAAV